MNGKMYVLYIFCYVDEDICSSRLWNYYDRIAYRRSYSIDGRCGGWTGAGAELGLWDAQRR
jgi:hypothetical protein